MPMGIARAAGLWAIPLLTATDVDGCPSLMSTPRVTEASWARAGELGTGEFQPDLDAKTSACQEMVNCRIGRRLHVSSTCNLGDQTLWLDTSNHSFQRTNCCETMT